MRGIPHRNARGAARRLAEDRRRLARGARQDAWASSATGTSARRSACWPKRWACRWSSTTSRRSWRWATPAPMPSLDALLEAADVVTLHVPETPQTQGMIGAAQLARMKPGAHLINASRGTVVDIDALAAALRSKHLAGAAIDVFPKEPKSAAEEFVSPLRGLDNVILTPHIGGSTEEAQENIGTEVAEKLIKYSNNGSTLSAVNFPEVSLPEHPGKHRLLHIHRNQPGVLSGHQRGVFRAADQHRRRVSADQSQDRLRGDRCGDGGSRGRGGAETPTGPGAGDDPDEGSVLKETNTRAPSAPGQAGRPTLPRIAAFDILRKVDGGGYASDLLLAHCAGLDSRDAGLASEIVFGVLRYRAQLDYLIEHYSGRRAKLDLEVRIALRMGIYQLRYLERVPAARGGGGERGAGEARAQALRRRASSTRCCARWTASRSRGPTAKSSSPARSGCWRAGSGITAPEAAAGIARAALAGAGEVLRRGGRACRISARNPSCRCCDLEPGQTLSRSVRRAGQQDRAGAGSRRARRRLRPALPPPGAAEGAARRPGGAGRHRGRCPSRRRFDRILVDAPCSGTGTLGRNPEIKWRLTPGRSRRPARAARRRCWPTRGRRWRPGGLLVYSTCSLEPEENEEVVGGGARRSWLPRPCERLPGREPGDGFYAAVIKSEKPANG